MSKLKQLEAFIKVVEAGSFAGAAIKLHLTPAAISKQIKLLETQLGIELLRRTTRKLKLTTVGEQYFQEIKPILNQLAEAETLVSQTRREPCGPFKIMSTRYYAEQYLLPKLPQFLARYPKLNLRLELAERLPNFMDEELDMLFGVTLKPSNLDLTSHLLDQTRYVFCAAPDYLAKFGVPKTPQDLQRHRYLAHVMRQKPNFVKFKNHEDVYVEPYLWLNDSNALKTCAVRGLGITLLHDYFVKTEVANGALVEVYQDYVDAKTAVYLYYRTARALDPKIQTFVDFFKMV